MHFPERCMYMCRAHIGLHCKVHYCTTIGRVFEQFESIGLVSKKKKNEHPSLYSRLLHQLAAIGFTVTSLYSTF